ncbi:hypothetical protein [Microbulbifer epialgicus]|uniref:Uncharacterized protein n=1 Tax=Microbulbifer epialgicus TaxID=393907 RepID=A0ABV4P5R5_9GAMM
MPNRVVLVAALVALLGGTTYWGLQIRSPSDSHVDEYFSELQHEVINPKNEAGKVSLITDSKPVALPSDDEMLHQMQTLAEMEQEMFKADAQAAKAEQELYEMTGGTEEEFRSRYADILNR